MSYFVYILYSEKNDRYYVGYSKNIDERLKKHNAGTTTSTRSGIPWKLVYSEKYDSKSDAIIREKEIKRKKSRKYIEFLISVG